MDATRDTLALINVAGIIVILRARNPSLGPSGHYNEIPSGLELEQSTV